jgi:uncharacterized membrane protein
LDGKQDVPSLAPTLAFESYKPTVAAAPAPVRAKRLDSLDLLRGIIMVIMALDHTRDYVSAFHFQPEDLSRSTAALFLTRWITHFCAPVFMFLAGTGAYLSFARGKTKAELSKFLVIRGLWLVVLEVTVSKFGWELFHYDPNSILLIVIWALGMSMIILSALIHLPVSALAIFSGIVIAGHNFLDGVSPNAFGSFSWLWKMLHVQGLIGSPPGSGSFGIFFVYPLIPWFAVMSMGYCFGALLSREDIRNNADKRRSTLLKIGLGLTAAFIVLRFINVIGDSNHWAAQKNGLFTFFSFLNTSKYPPSLLYLLMTLGPAIAFLPLLEKARGRIANFFLVFGRVPLFYYILHIPIINIIASSIYMYRNGHWPSVNPLLNPIGAESLPVVYLVWAVVIALLYPVCKWYMNLKARSNNPWLSYL